MIAIVDYRAGNLVSVKKAVDHLGFACAITSDPAVVERAEKVIVPGVGHFAATSTLADTGLRAAIAGAIERQTPFFGICVGMQWMFDSSEEAPGACGLGVFPGQCTHFPPEVKAPHVGWNQLEVENGSRLLRGVASGRVRLFHALLSRAAGRRHRGSLRLRRSVFRGGGARTSVRRAVPSGKIRRRRAQRSWRIFAGFDRAKTRREYVSGHDFSRAVWDPCCVSFRARPSELCE